jgi:hypothetical protein
MKLSIAAATLALASSASALTLNGWSPDATKFCFGLPGSVAPITEFDPFGLAKGKDLDTIKRWREAETQHSRVAMLAVIGLLTTEEPIEFHPLFEAATKDIGPAIRHLDEVRAVEPTAFEYLGIFIGSLEINRALNGWKKPSDTSVFQDLNEDYYPGDINFDPLGLKPEDPAKFAEIQTKELQNGRLAMLGIAGMVAQELLNGKEIFVNLGLATDRFNPADLPVQF